MAVEWFRFDGDLEESTVRYIVVLVEALLIGLVLFGLGLLLLVGIDR